jgi:hypothetical protein
MILFNRNHRLKEHKDLARSVIFAGSNEPGLIDAFLISLRFPEMDRTSLTTHVDLVLNCLAKGKMWALHDSRALTVDCRRGNRRKQLGSSPRLRCQKISGGGGDAFDPE